MLKYLVIFEKRKSSFSAYVPDLPGCVATGKTRKMVERNIYEAAKFHIEGLKEERLQIPKPSTESELLVFAA